MIAMRSLLVILVMLSAVILVSGCTSYAPPANPGGNGPGVSPTPSGSPTVSPSPSPGGIGAKTYTVTIKNFAFSPQTLTINKGDTVIWVNEDSAPHQIASNPHPTHTDLPGLVSGSLSTGQSYSFTFDKAGTFGYHCHIHPSMTGTIIVLG